MRVPVDPDAEPIERALAFLDEYKALYGLEDPWAQLFPQDVNRSEEGDVHVRLAQRWNGLPVYGAAISVHVAGDEVIATMGDYLPELAPGTPSGAAPAAEPTLSKGAVLQSARAHAEKRGADLEVLGEGKLLYFNPRILGAEHDMVHLTWKLPVRESGAERSYYVDAHDGTVVHNSTEERTEGPDKEFDLKTANGDDKKCWFIAGGNQWFTESGPSDEYPGGPMSFPGGDVDGDLVYDNTHKAWNFFYDNFGRNSYDDGGEEVVAYVHTTFRNGAGVPARNASYTGGVCDVFQFADNTVGLGIVGHEFTHAVTGFNYEFQSGAIDESYADVFGELIEEDNGGADWLADTFRSLQDPTLSPFSDPDHWADYRNKSIDEDNGGVHTNSGILNKAAYLLAEGGTHPRSSVEVRAIGTEKMKWLYYSVATAWLHSNATLVDVSNATVTLAQQYARERRHGYDNRDACSVVNAFAAVGLGTPDRDCDGEPDDVDRDDDGDYVPDDRDNCPNHRNPYQRDIDADGLGNACDDDLDGDGVDNDLDNCPRDANFLQSDTDSDGIGEVCDDDDSDWVFNTQDNCPDHANREQADLDEDGVGDICDGDRDGDTTPNRFDNCPDHVNYDQRDSDGDLVGDACDNCPDVETRDVADLDDDGIGDVCDGDVDGDGVLNGVDNCERSFNPGQFDIDTNGVGAACDDRETGVLSGNDALVIRELARHVQAADVLRIPVSPCRIAECPRVLPEDTRARLSVVSDAAIQVRIVDDYGKLVGKGKLSQANQRPEHSISFEVASDFHFDNGAEVFRGRNYFLEVRALESSKETINVTLQTLFPEPQ